MRFRSVSVPPLAMVAVLIAILGSGWFYWSVFSSTAQSAYPRTQFWIEAAACAQETGNYLVVCRDQKQLPIEDVSLADDRGHTLLLSFFSRTFKKTPTLDFLRQINLGINFLGFVFFCLVSLRFIGWRTSLFAAILGSYWIGARSGPDVDSAYIGISMLAAAGLVLAITANSAFRFPIVYVVGAFTALIREPIGLGFSMSLLSVAVVDACFIPHPKLKTRALRSVIMAAVAVLCFLTPRLPTKVRDVVLGTHPVGTAAHGISHNLFLGLGGFVENKWGIVWDDAYAQKKIHEIDPNIIYCSDAYFKAIGRLYVEYVSKDPGEALRVYLIKTGRTLSASEGLSLSVLLSFIIFAFLIWRNRRSGKSIAPRERLVASGIALFGFSFIAQGILTHPAWSYIHPGPVLLMICVMVSYERSLPRTK